MKGRIAQLVEDNRGISTNAAVGIVVAIAVTGFLVAFLFPVAVDNLADDRERTVTQDVGETVEVTPLLNSTLDATNASTDATYTLSDNSSSETNRISVGSSAEFNLDGGTVNVTVEEANSGNATATFAYDSDFGWQDGTSRLWDVLPIVLILGPFLLFVWIATRRV